MNDCETAAVARKKKHENALRLLAACFYEPDKELFVTEGLCEALRGCLHVACPEAVGFVDGMENAMERCTDEELKVAHAKLFVGPFSLAAAPYGSVYLDDGGRVMGDSTMDVIKRYEQEGLARSDDCKDLPDHIAVELEFVSYLMSREIAALEASDTSSAAAYESKRQSFADTLLRPWVPEFCQMIKEGTDNEFYTGLAGCTSTVIGTGI